MNPVSESTPVNEIDCRTTVTRLWDYLDEELDPRRYAEVDAHVRRCTECAEHFSFARAFLTVVSSSWPESNEAAQLRARVVERLHAEGFGRE